MSAQQVSVVVWNVSKVAGEVEVSHGTLTGLRILGGKGHANGNSFGCDGSDPCRLEIAATPVRRATQLEKPLVTVRAGRHPFSFFACDVTRGYPIFIPEYGVAVLPRGDSRTYAEVARDVRARGGRTRLRELAAGPEETFEGALANTRALHCPTWLGVGRDMRIFETDVPHAGERWFYAEPRDHSRPFKLAESDTQTLRYVWFLGRGIGCEKNIVRRLDGDWLPILRTEIRDNDVLFDCVSFVTLERSPLERGVRGTDYLVADGHGKGRVFTPEQEQAFERRLKTERNPGDQTVFCFRAVACNTAAVPRYAWFKTVTPLTTGPCSPLDPRTGMQAFAGGGVFAISRFNGGPLAREEMAMLLQPGESCTLEFRVPHRPLPRARAAAFLRRDFEALLADCRAYWRKRGADAARIRLPEKAIENRFRAGILHLDINGYGREPAGPVAPTVGVYAPIGSESAPILQIMDAIGRTRLAERMLHYFLAKQHDDGFMQNFHGYMLETGAVLWSMGEHFRTTRDERWVRRVRPNVEKACDYLLAWRRRNLKPALRGKGYGMLEGKVADPNDPYHIFMLNGYAYAGLIAAAEMLRQPAPAAARRYRAAAGTLKKDILTALAESMARSPVVPLGDGTWTPTTAAWAEGCGPMCLFVENKNCFSHGMFVCRDSTTGPLYLVLQDVLKPDEPLADRILRYHAEMFLQRNVGFSQPYYCRHDYAHVRRGEVAAFLKTYYNALAALADRETGTFWEHLFHVSPHKTHEEGWFLMQTRWMLWIEDGSDLRLLGAVPRGWLADGQAIALDEVQSHFGPVTLRVQSEVSRGRIVAEVAMPAARRPRRIFLRLPHPDGRRAVVCAGGRYDAERETVAIARFAGRARVELQF